MENASKALLMAGGILVGVLILALMVTLFASANSLFSTYDDNKKAEAVQQFNVNFTQFLGRELTVYEVVTISNFVEEHRDMVTIAAGSQTANQIKDSLSEEDMHKYRLIIVSYSDEGYIQAIKFEE